MVEQQHEQDSSVIGIYDSSSGLNGMLSGQTGTRSDSTVRSQRDGEGELGVDQSFPSGGDKFGFGAGKRGVGERKRER